MTVISVYGLSEASPGCTMSSVSDGKKIRYETVGRDLPEVECKIINPNTTIAMTKEVEEIAKKCAAAGTEVYAVSLLQDRLQ